MEIFDETDASLEDIGAPVEVRDVAGEILATEAKMSAVHHDRLDQLKDVTTGDELNAVFKLNQDYQDLVSGHGNCGQLAKMQRLSHCVRGAVRVVRGRDGGVDSRVLGFVALPPRPLP